MYLYLTGKELRSLEGEIIESLPDFHEMFLGLKCVACHLTSRNMDLKDSSGNRALQADMVQARKELLARFTRYEQLAKQIMDLPPLVDGLKSPTQKRLHEAILARANLFLRKHVRHMFRLIPRHSQLKACGPCQTSHARMVIASIWSPRRKNNFAL